jgi:hypothetical protein
MASSKVKQLDLYEKLRARIYRLDTRVRDLVRENRKLRSKLEDETLRDSEGFAQKYQQERDRVKSTHRALTHRHHCVKAVLEDILDGDYPKLLDVEALPADLRKKVRAYTPVYDRYKNRLIIPSDDDE